MTTTDIVDIINTVDSNHEQALTLSKSKYLGWEIGEVGVSESLRGRYPPRRDQLKVEISHRLGLGWVRLG